MQKINSAKRIALVVFLVVTLIGGYFVYSKQIPPSPITAEKISPTESVWTTYHDKKYGYSLDYPKRLSAQSTLKQEITRAPSLGGGILVFDGGAAFSESDGYWVIIVSVFEQSQYPSADDWFKVESNKFPNQRPVLEKRITIDGHEGIITYTESDHERKDAYKHEKTLVLIKNGTLFEIRTRFTDEADHFKVWESIVFGK